VSSLGYLAAIPHCGVGCVKVLSKFCRAKQNQNGHTIEERQNSPTVARLNWPGYDEAMSAPARCCIWRMKARFCACTVMYCCSSTHTACTTAGDQTWPHLAPVSSTSAASTCGSRHTPTTNSSVEACTQLRGFCVCHGQLTHHLV